MQIGQGEDFVGLDELHHLERSSVYSMKVAEEYLRNFTSLSKVYVCGPGLDTFHGGHGEISWM